MNPSKDFEEINFNLFNFSNDQDQQNMRDPDLNFFNNLNSNKFDSPYGLEENVKRYLCNIKKYDNFSLIQVNIRSLNSNFEKLHDLFLNCSNSLNIICVTEKWSTDKGFKNNSDFHLPNFDFIHSEKNWQNRGGGGGGILIDSKNDIKFNIVKDLSASDGNNKCVTVETENKNSKYLLILCCYRPPSGAIKGLNSFSENVFKKANTENKLCIVVGDFNVNCLNYNENLEIRTFYNRIFSHSCIPLITKPTNI